MIIKLSSLLLQMLHLNKLCLGIITGVIAVTGGGLIAAVTIGYICYRKHKKRKRICKGMSELAIKILYTTDYEYDLCIPRFNRPT